MVVESIRLILLPALMVFAAVSDLLTMTISNRVPIVLAAGFLLVAWTGGMPAAEMLSHTAAAAVVLIVTFGFFARGWMGGGDAKLASATALWLGFGYLPAYLLIASLFGGALTLLLLQFRLLPLPVFLSGQAWLERLHRKDGSIPYGIALAAAALVVYPDTPWMKALGM
jgi:prepilin peptidase CpaA